MNKNTLILLVLCISLPIVTQAVTHNVLYNFMKPNQRLMLASCEGDMQQLQKALTAGADPNYKDELIGATALHYAVRAGKVEMVKHLLEQGAHVNVQEDVSFETPLHWAVDKGDTSVIRLLLEKGPNKLIENTNGKTPLDLAKEKGNRELAQSFGEVSLLKALSVQAIVKCIRQNELSLEQVKNSVPVELYELITEYL